LTQEVITEILTKYRNVAVVGVSRDPSKPSYEVAEYLKQHGFHIVPINPFIGEVLGEKTYKSLLDVPLEVQKSLEIVDIFRPSVEVLPIVEQAVQLKKQVGRPFVVWMQLGIVNEQAAEVAKAADLLVVMDKCMKQEHTRLFVREEDGS
jgi:predicted CoA-binding protein